MNNEWRQTYRVAETLSQCVNWDKHKHIEPYLKDVDGLARVNEEIENCNKKCLSK